MYYKHLSKYHYIYRLSFGGDMKAHVEKMPIAYSNSQYIYVIRPGADRLQELELCDVCKEVSETIRDKIITYLSNKIKKYQSEYHYYTRDFYFLLDNSDILNDFARELEKLDFNKEYLLSEEKRLQYGLKRAVEESAKWRQQLDDVQRKLKNFEE